MSVRLDWRVGATGDDEAINTLRSPRVVPRRSARRLALTPRFMAFYGLALLVAGVAGFGIGRFSQARSTLWSGVNRSVGIETAAWQTADVGLLADTLDPGAPAAWRAALARRLQRRAPEPMYDVRVRSIAEDTGGTVTAVVDVRSGGTLRREERWYRRHGDSLYRYR